MKRLIMALIVLFTAATLFAGGKECEAKHAKSVELSGTLSTWGTGDAAKTVFHVANSDRTYTVCEKSKASVLKLSNSGAIHIKGKVVNCSDTDGEELVIDSANKI
jgi:hypothetical protein